MVGTVARVIASEGLHSAFTRALERASEAFTRNARDAQIVNVAPGGTGARTGGIAVQLAARLREERKLRDVRVVHRLREMPRAIHLEGTVGIDADAIRRWIDDGARVVISLHDTAFRNDRHVLDAATAVIFPSHFLRGQYGVAGHVIEPASMAARVDGGGDGIAFAGSVKHHKGGHLLPEIADALGAQTLHVFGGGDAELLRPLRKRRNVIVHGYYRAATLPALLARHRIGTVLLPSIVPESFSLTLSEAWLAGATVLAFDHGAIADRIRLLGGGHLALLASGARGLVELLAQPKTIAPQVPSPRDAALAHLALYRTCGLLS